jgi:two-component system, OmpR family, heavy metal sensor histidine kinase CusS
VKELPRKERSVQASESENPAQTARASVSRRARARSLNTRLLAWVAGSLTLLLTMFGVSVYEAVRHTLVEEFDVSLVTSAQALRAMVAGGKDNREMDVEAGSPGEGRRRRSILYFQVWREDGTVFRRSATLGQSDLMPMPDGSTKMVRGHVVLPDGHNGRVVILRFADRGESSTGHTGTRLVMAVARDAGSIDEELRELRWALFTGGTLTMLMALVVSGVIVRRSLHPLRTLATRIATIREGDLHARIADGQGIREMLPVVDRLNDLLERLEAAFSRERAFTADVAHELRTPLAGVRSTIEVALHKERTGPEYREALTDCLSILRQMQAMVDNLLLLAGLDAGRTDFQWEKVEMAELIDSCWRTFASEALERRLTFENRVPAPLACVSDRSNLGMAIANLLANAVEYTAADGQVWATGRETSDAIEVCISNTGCRLTGEQVVHVFDRFWRGETSRSDTGVHAGLGLALVRRILTSLGGDASASLETNGVFTVCLRLPRGEQCRA